MLRVDLFSAVSKKKITFTFDGEKVNCSDKRCLRLLEEDGVRGSDGRAYFPRDGKAFIESLQYGLNGSLMWASEPYEVEIPVTRREKS